LQNTGLNKFDFNDKRQCKHTLLRIIDSLKSQGHRGH